MIGTVLALGSLAASAFASAKSAQANNAVDKQLDGRMSELEAWYQKEYNTPYLATEEAKSAITVLREQMKDQLKKQDQNNAIVGGSDERRVATAESMNKNLNNTVTRLAGYGTQYRDNARRSYMGYKGNLDNMKFGVMQQKAQNWSNLAGNAVNAFGGVVEADANGAFDKWDGSIKNWFSGLKKGGTAPMNTIQV